jgi:hypothetical protein
MTYFDRNLAALDAIEDLLEAYAEARLRPAGPVLARIRRNVMAQAAAAAMERQPMAPVPAAPSRWHLPGVAFPRIQVPTRAAALGFAAVLTLGTSAAVLAAPPGSPFSNARAVLEAMTVPNSDDARLAAHEQHLGERLAAAELAAARGDAAGLEAALAAYQAEVDAALADIGNDADRLAHLEAMLAKHVAVLTSLEVTVPEQASVDKAIDTSQKAIVKIKAKGSKSVGKPAAQPTKPDPGPDSAPGRS